MQGIVFLPTRDLGETDRFYTETLCRPMVLDQGKCRIYQVGDAFWGFCESMEPLVDPARITLTIVDQNVDAWYDTLTAAGVKTDAPPRQNERFRIYHFYTSDPNGYQVEIQRFLHPFP